MAVLTKLFSKQIHVRVDTFEFYVAKTGGDPNGEWIDCISDDYEMLRLGPVSFVTELKHMHAGTRMRLDRRIDEYLPKELNQRLTLYVLIKVPNAWRMISRERAYFFEIGKALLLRFEIHES